MNPSAIYSKSGKGVQEAAGKTSHLSRPDRAVLSAIDGRTTLAEVAEKVGKTFDADFARLIATLDKGGFIREVSAGTAGPAPRPGARPAPKPAPTVPMDEASDLDFTTALSMPKGRATPPPQAPPRATPPPPKHTVTIPPPPPPPSAAEKAKAEKVAKEQQDAFAKAREEAERKAAAERERLKAEAEAKMRADAEANLRAEAAAEAEAKIKAAREAAVRAAAEAKAKAEAEAKKAREEAERARKEAEEQARREREELERKLEAERKAREEAERRAQEETRRLEEERRKFEEERRRAEQAIAKAKEKAREKAEEPAPAKPASAGGFSDSLLADLESFTNRDEEERREEEESERQAKEAAAQLAREAEERRAKEDAEREAREAKEQRKREEAERKLKEEEELREREEREKERLREEEERRRKEAEEREKKAKQEERLAAKATRGPEFDAAQLRSRREREMAAKRKPAAARVERKGWGKPIALTLFVLLVIAVGVAHVMPIDTADYERAATEALGRPVRISSANLSLVTGLQLKFSGVAIGDELKIAEVRAYPEIGALLGPDKAFNRIEVEGLKVDQGVLGEGLFTKLGAENFSVAKVIGRQLELVGPLALPKGLDVEINYGRDGVVRSAVVRGPEALTAKLTPKASSTDVDMTASSFTLPFAPEITLARFSMRGTATPRGLTVQEWDGALLNGTVSGTATVRWGETWAVDGLLTARSINAAVFAPALLSEGRGEGSGKFSMRGQPGKLASSSRLDGNFTVSRGVLGSIDLSRAIQTGGKQATGRTQFNEMNGQATYDRGAVSLRNVTIGAGQLNAGASADISQNGALSGRIVADVRVASQTLRATLNLGGTVKEPQVRN